MFHVWYEDLYACTLHFFVPLTLKRTAVCGGKSNRGARVGNNVCSTGWWSHGVHRFAFPYGPGFGDLQNSVLPASRAPPTRVKSRISSPVDR